MNFISSVAVDELFGNCGRLSFCGLCSHKYHLLAVAVLEGLCLREGSAWLIGVMGTYQFAIAAFRDISRKERILSHAQLLRALLPFYVALAIMLESACLHSS